MWRQKGYGNTQYKKSIVEERGYDLRTKEGREKHAKNKANESIAFICVATGAGASWLAESPHGAWAGYILFWLLLAIQKNSFSTMVWMISVHGFAIAGYGISLLFDGRPIEPALWGAIIGNFVAAHLTKKMGINLFLGFTFLGCWAFFGEPSTYFSDLADRLVNSKYTGLPAFGLSVDMPTIDFTSDKELTSLFFILNIYATVALFFGFYTWGLILWEAPKRVASGALELTILRLLNIVIYSVSIPCVALPAFGFFLLLFDYLPIVDETNFYNYPIMILILLGFSPTLGVIVNIRLRRSKNQRHPFWPIILQCISTCFWLPVLLRAPVPKKLNKKSELITKVGSDRPSKANKKSPTTSKRKVPPKNKDYQASALSGQYLKLSREKFSDKDLDNALENIVGLGKKRRAAITKTFPDLQEVLEKSDSEINTQTGLSLELISRLKFALREAQKVREMNVLSEYLSYVFPLKSRPRKVITSAFSTFDQLYLFCINPDDTLTGLNRHDLAHLIQKTVQQQMNDNRV